MRETSWLDRRVLVTGARGFIGSSLCRRLLDSGATVYGASRHVPASQSGVRWLNADLTDGSSVRRLLADVRPDIVFHLAGHVTGRQQLEHVEPTFLMNLASTVHLLTVAAETAWCRVVLCGSMQEPQAADAIAVPCSPYAASKWACAGYARMFHALYQLPVVIARPFMVYGPLQWDRTKLLPYVITSLLKGEPPCVSSGTRELDWIYIDDVVDGLVLLADSPRFDGRTVDIGSGRLTTIRRTVELVVETLGSPVAAQYGSVPDRPLERPHAADVDETRRLIGWTPSISLPEGLARTIAWYRTQLASGPL